MSGVAWNSNFVTRKLRLFSHSIVIYARFSFKNRPVSLMSSVEGIMVLNYLKELNDCWIFPPLGVQMTWNKKLCNRWRVEFACNELFIEESFDRVMKDFSV